MPNHLSHSCRLVPFLGAVSTLFLINHNNGNLQQLQLLGELTQYSPLHGALPLLHGEQPLSSGPVFWGQDRHDGSSEDHLCWGEQGVLVRGVSVLEEGSVEP